MTKTHKTILIVLGIPFLMFVIFVTLGFNETNKDTNYYKSIGLDLNGNIESV